MKYLPRDLWILIYEFDPTFLEYMRKFVLIYIHPHIAFSHVIEKRFMILDERHVLVTNHLETPTYITVNNFPNRVTAEKFIDTHKENCIRILLTRQQVDFIRTYDFASSVEDAIDSS